jgi:TRAP-type transport system periplasmic protein
VSRALLVLSLLAAAPRFAAAERIVLRMAAIAPDGTAWARTLKGFADAVALDSKGSVAIKWYLGGIAGDERDVIGRIRRDQLDGAAGAMFCYMLAPSLQVTRVAGLLKNRDEAKALVNEMRSTIDGEFRKNGFVYLGSAGFGLDILFTRRPIRSLADLRSGTFWIRQYDEVLRAGLAAMNVRTLELPHEEAVRAYDDGRVDGFIGAPGSALAFQWYSHARYFTNLKLAYLDGCIGIRQSAFDQLSSDDQAVMRNQAALLAARFDDTGRDADAQLVGRLFAKQGLVAIEPGAQFDAEFAKAARATDSSLGGVPAQLLGYANQTLQRVRAMVRP